MPICYIARPRPVLIYNAFQVPNVHGLSGNGTALKPCPQNSTRGGDNIHVLCDVTDVATETIYMYSKAFKNIQLQ